MGKMWIRQVKAIRNDGNASTIDLQQGLNCIIGPSNTGKTGIAKNDQLRMRRKRHTIHGCHRICRSIRHLQYRTRRSDITTLVGFANDSGLFD